MKKIRSAIAHLALGIAAVAVLLTAYSLVHDAGALPEGDIAKICDQPWPDTPQATLARKRACPAR